MSPDQDLHRPTRWWGAVLTGGRSTRMGTDKALVELDGATMAERVSALVRAAGAERVSCVGGDGPALRALGLEVVADPDQGEGPVAGIRTALEWARAGGIEVVAVVATDLPWLEADTVAVCVRRALSDGAPVVVRGERLEPLVGAWPVSCRDAVDAAWAAGLRSVRDVLAATGHGVVDVERVDQLTNLNEPDQLRWRPNQSDPRPDR